MRDFLDKEKNYEMLVEYCRAVGWDSGQLWNSFRTNGIAKTEIFLESPLKTILDNLKLFLTSDVTNIFIILGQNGMGKTALKDYFLQPLQDYPEFLPIGLNNAGRLTPYQLTSSIFKKTSSGQKVPRSQGVLLDQLENAMITKRKEGCTTLVWVDEGQKLRLNQIEILRELSDLKTDANTTVCKIVITGTEDLQKKLEVWNESDPEEAGAFLDRCGFCTFKIKAWQEERLAEWITLLHQNLSLRKNLPCPFSQSTISTIFRVTEGSPRLVNQLVYSVLMDKMARYSQNPTERDTTITADDIETTLKAMEV